MHDDNQEIHLTICGNPRPKKNNMRPARRRNGSLMLIQSQNYIDFASSAKPQLLQQYKDNAIDYDESGKAVYSNIVKTKAITTGAKVKLTNAAFYAASSSKTAARTGVSGTYYIWSATVINNRVRVTTQANLVGKSGQVTAWVPVANITVL